MLRQIELLLRVRTCNLFGINEARYGKKGKQRGARIALMFAMALVTLVLCCYVAGLCYALSAIGAGKAIPMLLALVTGVVVLMLTMFRAGPVIFDLHSYEQLDAQGIEGKNISESKQQIEGTMDTMISAFEKQLDNLFTSESMDISADIAAMQNLMRADGLIENEFSEAMGKSAANEKLQ